MSRRAALTHQMAESPFETTPGRRYPEAVDVPDSLADRINALFATFHPAGKRPPSIEVVCQRITERGGPTISIGYLSELRTGKATNPRLDHLRAIADFFEVDVSYFTDDEKSAEIASQLRLLRAMRDSRVRAFALRASELDAASLDALATIMEQALPRPDNQPSAAPSGQPNI